MENLPTFSVIVPTFRRPGHLLGCLEALSNLNTPRSAFEVIVVDDGSEILPETMLARFRDSLDFTVLTQPHAGPAAARNTGAERARGRYLAFTDDDCAPEPDWLLAFADRLAQSPGAALGGRTFNAIPENPYSSLSQNLVDCLYVHLNSDPDRAKFFASSNAVFPADRFHRVGGFDPAFPFAAGEDRDLCDRWLKQGYRMAYVPQAVVQHIHPLTVRTFFRQQFNYGRGALAYHRKRAQREGLPPRLEPGRFYVKLLSCASSRAQGRRQKAVARLLVALSQFALAAGYFWESRRGTQAP